SRLIDLPYYLRLIDRTDTTGYSAAGDSDGIADAYPPPAEIGPGKDRAMHLPDWIYRLLPSAYVAFGVLAIIGLRSTLGFISGALLLAAGMIISKLRREYARGKVVLSEKTPWIDDGEPLRLIPSPEEHATYLLRQPRRI